MSEPVNPQPPAPPEKKKGLSPVAWILIGCIGLLLLFGLGMGACTILLGKKVRDVAQEYADDPSKAARTAAEWVVKADPDLELVDTDEDAQTMTVRDKRTGEETTLDWSEITEGNFKMSSGEGEFRVDATGDEGGAVITMTDAEGETTSQVFGTGAAAEVPDWIPLARGAGEATSAYRSSSGGQVSGAFTYVTSESVSDVLAFYAEEMTDGGYEISQSTYSSGGRSGGGVNGTLDDGDRSLNVGVSDTGDGTQVTVTYSYQE